MGKTRIVRQLRHGQITIPKEFRDALGLGPDDLLQVELRDDRLLISAAEAAPKGSQWLLDLYNAFAPVREAMKDRSEDEINEMIQEAVDEYRASQREAAKKAAAG